MNELTNHGVSRAFQLLWRRRPRVAAASWCKRRYGREREWRSRVGLTECGKCGSGTSVDNFNNVRKFRNFNFAVVLFCQNQFPGVRMLLDPYVTFTRIFLVLLM